MGGTLRLQLLLWIVFWCWVPRIEGYSFGGKWKGHKCLILSFQSSIQKCIFNYREQSLHGAGKRHSNYGRGRSSSIDNSDYLDVVGESRRVRSSDPWKTLVNKLDAQKNPDSKNRFGKNIVDKVDNTPGTQ